MLSRGVCKANRLVRVELIHCTNLIWELSRSLSKTHLMRKILLRIKCMLPLIFFIKNSVFFQWNRNCGVCLCFSLIFYFFLLVLPFPSLPLAILPFKDWKMKTQKQKESKGRKEKRKKENKPHKNITHKAFQTQLVEKFSHSFFFL